MSVIVVVIAVGVVGVTAFVVYGGRALVALTGADDEAHLPDARVLRYRLVAGQDSPSLVDAVRGAGYHATTEYDMGQVDLVVLCTGDPTLERERVRAAIADAPGRDGGVRDFAIPPVRFVDETG